MYQKSSILTFVTALLIFVSINLNLAYGQQAKYVFYFIGDGMGLSHIATAEAYLAAMDGELGFKKMSFSEFPHAGFATTYAGNRLVTGSAAAGTALATGHKTSIGTIGMDETKTIALKTIAEEAKNAGLKVGIISSVSIDHATPACFYAHQAERGMYYEIALDLPASKFDFFGGGGFRNSAKKGQISPYDFAIKNGYTVTNTKKDFYNLKKGAKKIFAVGSVIEPSGALRYAIDQTDEDIPLEDFVAKSIEVLDNEKGFFIMCEEGKIDWAAHDNDGVSVIHNVISLSASVEEALAFYQQHPDETLIVVTADHETGGLTLGHALMKYDSRFEILSAQKVSKQTFTVIADSLFTIPSNQNLGFAMQLVEDYFGLGGSSGISLTDYEISLLEQAYYVDVEEMELSHEDAYLNYGGSYPLAAAAAHILNNKAGIAWTTWSHTGTPVPVFAIGAGAQLFDGYYDNTDIPKKIARAMGIDFGSESEY